MQPSGVMGRDPYLDDLARLDGQRGEVPAAVNRHALPEDGVQALHLIPRQHAVAPTLLRLITGGHDDAALGRKICKSKRCVFLYFLMTCEAISSTFA